MIHTLSDLQSKDTTPIVNPWSNNNISPIVNPWNSNPNTPLNNTLDPFWSDNIPLANGNNLSFFQTLLIRLGCSCFLGDVCSSNRKHDYKELIKTFYFWISLCQILYFLFSMLVDCISRHFPLFEISSKTFLLLGGLSFVRIKCSYQIWRLMTPIFLHDGIFHLLFNMFFQYRYVLYNERRWGLIKMVCVYGLSGLMGSCLALVLSPSSVGVGASGCLFGVFACAVLDIIKDWNDYSNQAKMMHGINIGFFLLVSLGMTFSDVSISIGAHIGGFIGGVLVGLCFLHVHVLLRILGGALYAVLLVAGSLYAVLVVSQQFRCPVKA